MAIITISRIQHRRGIKFDLPENLYEGEIGWCLDTRELYIGNGEGFSGNTQILTEWSPNDQIIKYTYTGSSGIAAKTGPIGSSTVRTLKEKLDDILNVRDYGAKGDGVTDDTDAIQRAIADRWISKSDLSSRALMSMVNIMLPAGTYNITGSLELYPLTTLIGEGTGKTVIKMSQSSAASIARTADSLGNTGANIGQNSAILPTNITVKGITFDNSENLTANGLLIERAAEFMIADCEIINAWSSGDSISASNKAIDVRTRGNLYLTDYVKIVNTRMSGFVYGIHLNDPVRYLTVDKSTIDNCWQGALIGDAPVAGGPSYINITNSTFKNIDSTGLAVYSQNPGILSSNNTYDTVGDQNNDPAIVFGAFANGCSSVNDVFSRNDNTKVSIANSAVNLFISPQQVSLSSNSPIPIGPFNLLNNVTGQPLSVSYNTSIYNTVFINYSIKRGSSRRAGTITLITDGTDVTYDDIGVDHNGSTGITITAALAGSNLILYYSSTNTGQSGQLSFIETKWFA